MGCVIKLTFSQNRLKQYIEHSKETFGLMPVVTWLLFVKNLLFRKSLKIQNIFECEHEMFSGHQKQKSEGSMQFVHTKTARFFLDVCLGGKNF